MYGQGMAMNSGAEFFHVISGLLWLIILAALVVILVRWALRGGRRGMWMRHHMQGDSAIELLKERYAKGEIDKSEFEQKKKDLMS